MIRQVNKFFSTPRVFAITTLTLTHGVKNSFWHKSFKKDKIVRVRQNQVLILLEAWAGGGTGRRDGLKIRWPQGRAGSSPALPSSFVPVGRIGYGIVC